MREFYSNRIVSEFCRFPFESCMYRILKSKFSRSTAVNLLIHTKFSTLGAVLTVDLNLRHSQWVYSPSTSRPRRSTADVRRWRPSQHHCHHFRRQQRRFCWATWEHHRAAWAIFAAGAAEMDDTANHATSIWRCNGQQSGQCAKTLAIACASVSACYG